MIQLIFTVGDITLLIGYLAWISRSLQSKWSLRSKVIDQFLDTFSNGIWPVIFKRGTHHFLGEPQSPVDFQTDILDILVAGAKNFTV